jgi:pimeloyl-ACP methyl ester carboxylesterase
MLTVEIRLEQEQSRAHQLSVLACLPEAAALRPPYIVVFAGPGGGYSKEYFDLHIPGETDYSQAEFFARAGILLLAFDHVGVGQTRTNDAADVSREIAAAVNDALVRELTARISAGTLDPAIEALPGVFRVLMGQSMGGCLAIIQQGNHRSCDALAVLGYSAIHTAVPPDIDPSLPPLVHGFFWNDVPQVIVQQDFAGGYPIRRTSPSWGSPTVPRYAMGMTTPGIVAAESARIDVPVLLAFGERDVSENPWAEPSAYRKSSDVSLYVAPRMAHMHNFASDRQRLWERMVAWIRLQVQAAQ